MFLKRAMSMFLAINIFLESSLVWILPNKTKTKVTEPVVTPIVESETIIVDDSIIDVEEVVSDVIEEEPSPVIQTELPLTDSEIDLVALVTMAEAEGEPEEGKRLVIDVILNRWESSRFPNTIDGVIYAKNAFECMWNGRVDRCYVRDDIRQLVVEELTTRTNSNIHYFRADRYHSFGKPVLSVGNHYFSTY